MGTDLFIVCRTISAHLSHKAGLQIKEGATGAVTLIQQAGFTHGTARTGAVTFIQRLGSALNLEKQA